MGRSEGERTRLARVAAVLFALWLVHDFIVPPRYAIDARAAILAIDAYRATVSPYLTGIIQCRFTPTCSWYGHESIRKYGLMIGGVRTIARIARCGPWTRLGTSDPP